MNPTLEDIEAFRALLAALGPLPLAALLRELGVILFNREVIRWRVLVDISDELIDAEMLAVRERLIERVIHRKPPAVLASRTTLKQQRRLQRRKRS